ncbi:UDP-N-acetylmuramoylalanine--D-glutamate ligase [Geobacter sp. OR-1]|uniref:UDP-N-acetylmuramoyl-L-alanine--D-glutamate ligase n=1 Tax=Geobacter sp. OR-1 TaxID=1266765 RepID=UPI000541A6CF|nr:UDP-N-acetylmuramoyl-L-alanine--D-glutamate ligase [Geobacter sp. OR-1]GAM09514.1 UDP-N-acetylmuramoylalanine--D-glutamate ligase [Geobacter sp. OR-1]
MNLFGKKILVVGLAKTGVAVARFLAKRGAAVTVTDMKDAAALQPFLTQLGGLDLNLELGVHSVETFIAVDMIVVSPGVPMDIEPLRLARERRVPVISEIELASRFIEAPVIAITGTNGKTTTTTLTGEICRKSGFATFVGGNIGNPLIDLVEQGEAVERVVVELSSFQLEAIECFRPRVAVLLNITEDHLDRYDSYQEYIDAKVRVFMNQTGADYAVLNLDDPIVADLAGTMHGRICWMSQRRELEEGIFHRNGEIVFRWDGLEEVIPTAGFRIKGVHNTENIMAALAATMLTGCPALLARRAVEEFRGLPHRMELVREINGVGWYEDSKATNVGSVEKALASFNDITWIAGGKDKGGSYAPLAELVRERVRCMILIGEAKERIAAELGRYAEVRMAATLEEAVGHAVAVTGPGGVVLFSPACSSFDMFRDYEDRAEQFKALVRKLPGAEPR